MRSFLFSGMGERMARCEMCWKSFVLLELVVAVLGFARMGARMARCDWWTCMNWRSRRSGCVRIFFVLHSTSIFKFVFTMKSLSAIIKVYLSIINSKARYLRTKMVNDQIFRII